MAEEVPVCRSVSSNSDDTTQTAQDSQRSSAPQTPSSNGLSPPSVNKQHGAALSGDASFDVSSNVALGLSNSNPETGLSSKQELYAGKRRQKGGVVPH